MRQRAIPEAIATHLSQLGIKNPTLKKITNIKDSVAMCSSSSFRACSAINTKLIEG